METSFSDEETGGLGTLVFQHGPGTFSPSHGTRISILTVGRHQELLRGQGLDWGCGIGCLAIAAAKIPAVDGVVGLDIEPASVAASRTNAALNHVESKTRFFLSDSYQPFKATDRLSLEDLRGKLGFIMANPPASIGDDGFGYRRVVLAGARSFLAPRGVVFLSISQQYGPKRIASLSNRQSGFRYGGLLESTDWVPFDLRRADLNENIRDYRAAEMRGEEVYRFRDAETGAELDARSALARYEKDGLHPLSKWQTHLFEAR